MAAERVALEQVKRFYFADLCYAGQSHHLQLAIPLGDDLIPQLRADFIAMHKQLYGHAVDSPIRFVNLRVVHTVAADEVTPHWRTTPGTGAGNPLKGARSVSLPDLPSPIEAQVFDRTSMPAGMTIAGPFIAEQEDSTILVGPGWEAVVAGDGSLVITNSTLSRSECHQ